MCSLVRMLTSLIDFESENNDFSIVAFNILWYYFQQSLLFLNVISFFTFIPSNYTSKDLNKIIIINQYAFELHAMQNVWTCLQAK